MENKITPLVSVIMPVYNSEKLIKRSIDCLISQTLSNIEILLVDDGSTDNTSAICDEYATLDCRIRVFHKKKNEGVASARQLGIENAKGLYSIHFDADDYAYDNMLENMYHTAVKTNADIVIADYYDQTPEKDLYYTNQKFKSTKSSDILIEILEGFLYGALWNKLIRSSLFKKKKIEFITGINYCEDVLVLAKMLKDDDIKIVHLPNAYYVYCRENTESITKHYDESKLHMRVLCIDELHNILTNPKYKHALESVIWEVKMEAYRYGIIKLKDFEKVHHSSFLYIYHTKLNKKKRFFLMLSSAVHSICKL